MMGVIKEREWFFSSFTKSVITVNCIPLRQTHWLQTFEPHPQHSIAMHYVLGFRMLYPYLWRHKDQMCGRNVESAECWVLRVQVVQ